MEDDVVVRPDTLTDGFFVVANGQCILGAIAHGADFKNDEEVPNGNHQTELADELRAQSCR